MSGPEERSQRIPPWEKRELICHSTEYKEQLENGRKKHYQNGTYGYWGAKDLIDSGTEPELDRNASIEIDQLHL